MADQSGFIFSADAMAEFTRILRKVDRLRGVGVTNTKNDIVIGPPVVPPLRQPVAPAAPPFKARITAVAGSFPQWTYTVQRVVYYDSTKTAAAKWVTDGNNLTAANGAEFAGTAPYTYGNGVLITNATTGAVNSASCVIQPIGVGGIVDVTECADQNGASVYVFPAMNSAQ